MTHRRCRTSLLQESGVPGAAQIVAGETLNSVYYRPGVTTRPIYFHGRESYNAGPSKNRK